MAVAVSVLCCGARVCTCSTPLCEADRRFWVGGIVFREDALVRALCPGALRAGLLRAAWRTALCACRWRKAGGFFFCRNLVLFYQKDNSRNCVWVAGGLSPCECVC